MSAASVGYAILAGWIGLNIAVVLLVISNRARGHREAYEDDTGTEFPRLTGRD